MIVVNATIVAAIDLIVLTARAIVLILLIHAIQMPIADILIGQATILIAEETIATWIRRRDHHITHLIETDTIVGAGEILEKLTVQILRQTEAKHVEEEATATHCFRAECLAGRHGGAADDTSGLAWLVCVRLKPRPTHPFCPHLGTKSVQRKSETSS